MSYRIEYNWAVFKVPPQTTGLDEDRFVVAIEGGDNNVWCGNKRARDWSVCMIGTTNEVLKQAVDYAGSCAGGSLKPNGRDCTPESYIRRVRRFVEKPQITVGFWEPLMRIPEGHPIIGAGSSLNLEIEHEKWYGSTRARIRFPSDQLGAFFRLVSQYRDLRPWQFAEVHGLPTS